MLSAILVALSDVTMEVCSGICHTSCFIHAVSDEVHGEVGGMGYAAMSPEVAAQRESLLVRGQCAPHRNHGLRGKLHVKIIE
jgi:hypothetical protein